MISPDKHGETCRCQNHNSDYDHNLFIKYSSMWVNPQCHRWKAMIQRGRDYNNIMFTTWNERKKFNGTTWFQTSTNHDFFSSQFFKHCRRRISLHLVHYLAFLCCILRQGFIMNYDALLFQSTLQREMLKMSRTSIEHM